MDEQKYPDWMGLGEKPSKAERKLADKILAREKQWVVLCKSLVTIVYRWFSLAYLVCETRLRYDRNSFENTELGIDKLRAGMERWGGFSRCLIRNTQDVKQAVEQHPVENTDLFMKAIAQLFFVYTSRNKIYGGEPKIDQPIIEAFQLVTGVSLEDSDNVIKQKN